MEERVKLSVLGISYNQIQSGAYALLLTREERNYCIPVVIGAAEAQSIAVLLEGVKLPRPLTHDLFVSFSHAFGIRLEEVFIYKYDDGIFSSEMTFTDGECRMQIDARTSDAIAVAMRCNAPITTTEEIIEQAGFYLEGEGLPAGQTKLTRTPKSANLEGLSLRELERRLSQLIDDENYEEAARVNQIIKSKKNI